MLEPGLRTHISPSPRLPVGSANVSSRTFQWEGWLGVVEEGLAPSPLLAVSPSSLLVMAFTPAAEVGCCLQLCGSWFCTSLGQPLSTPPQRHYLTTVVGSSLRDLQLNSEGPSELRGSDTQPSSLYSCSPGVRLLPAFPLCCLAVPICLPSPPVRV